MKKEQIAIVIITMIDPAETYLVKKTTSKKTGRPIKKSQGQYAKIMPAVQATPFPPLKDANIGKMCPIVVTKPNKIRGIWGIRSLLKILKLNKATSDAPLIASIAKTVNPALTPNTRIVFVEPMFLLP